MPDFMPPTAQPAAPLDKPTLRHHIRALKRGQTATQLREWSALLADALATHPWFVAARSVMLFASLPDEPDTSSLLSAFAASKRLFLPAVVGDEIEVRRYSPDNVLTTGAYGISEPTGDVLHDLAELDLIVVPGVAFDPEGHRLGRGRGYYDRLFARADAQPPSPTRPRRLGYAFPFQILPHVPSEPHDALMDTVLTL